MRLKFILATFYFLRFLYFSIKTRGLLSYRYYPGYHGSTIPNLKEIRENKDLIFGIENINDGISYNLTNQISCFKELIQYKDGYKPPLKQDATIHNLYFYDNGMLEFNDGFFLYAFIKKLHPKTIIEIGSGHSSGLMIETCKSIQAKTKLFFIDPYSTTIENILKKSFTEEHQLIKKEAQKMDLTFFKQLHKNDILFIDSSHIVKIGSDVNHILFSILPSLNSGVYVHIHDIWFPWEYPEEIIFSGRFYNELYAIRSFLQFNASFEIVYFSSYMEKNCADLYGEHRSFFRGSGVSLWIKKL